jgi:lipoate-protein ligase A
VTAWTLLEAEELTPAANMALDLGILGASVAEERPDPVVRLYAWHPPTLSVGAKVDLPEDVRQRCAAAGVDVVHRATGGGCVLHDRDVTYSVVAPEEGRSVLEAYGWVAGGLVAGLHQLGIEATVAGHPATGRPLDCFAVATGADLEVGGRKICGSAQVRRRGWFLQHGSLPIVDIREKMATLLGDNADRTSTCVEEWRPGTTWSETASALIAGFAVAWGAEPSRRRPERLEWGSGGEAPQYRGVPEGPRAAAVLRNPLGMV